MLYKLCLSLCLALVFAPFIMAQTANRTKAAQSVVASPNGRFSGSPNSQRTSSKTMAATSVNFRCYFLLGLEENVIDNVLQVKDFSKALAFAKKSGREGGKSTVIECPLLVGNPIKMKMTQREPITSGVTTRGSSRTLSVQFTEVGTSATIESAAKGEKILFDIRYQTSFLEESDETAVSEPGDASLRTRIVEVEIDSITSLSPGEFASKKFVNNGRTILMLLSIDSDENAKTPTEPDQSRESAETRTPPYRTHLGNSSKLQWLLAERGLEKMETLDVNSFGTQLFDRFDTDGDGLLKGDELVAITKFRDQADSDNNDEVSRDEFNLVIKTSFEARNEELRRQITNRKMRELANAIRLFKAKKGKFPRSLQSLVPGYLSELPKDPWKTDFIYRYDSQRGRYQIISWGKDKQANTQDDLVSEVR